MMQSMGTVQADSEPLAQKLCSSVGCDEAAVQQCRFCMCGSGSPQDIERCSSSQTPRKNSILEPSLASDDPSFQKVCHH